MIDEDKERLTASNRNKNRLKLRSKRGQGEKKNNTGVEEMEKLRPMTRCDWRELMLGSSGLRSAIIIPVYRQMLPVDKTLRSVAACVHMGVTLSFPLLLFLILGFILIWRRWR